MHSWERKQRRACTIILQKRAQRTLVQKQQTRPMKKPGAKTRAYRVREGERRGGGGSGGLLCMACAASTLLLYYRRNQPYHSFPATHRKTPPRVSVQNNLMSELRRRRHGTVRFDARPPQPSRRKAMTESIEKNLALLRRT